MTNVQPGAYVLSAVAMDNDGATNTSSPVAISVVTNLPPLVEIKSPRIGASYQAPASVAIHAETKDPDGIVASVESFADTNSLGLVTNSAPHTKHKGQHSDFQFTWHGAPAGAYALTAVATDDGGTSSTSAPVSITVRPPPPPSLKISTDGQSFVAPANIWICSATKNFPDAVASVEYFAGTDSLGISTKRPFFCFHWTNVQAGAYVLTGTATDLSGTNIVTSTPVPITVKTNRPPAGRRHTSQK